MLELIDRLEHLIESLEREGHSSQTILDAVRVTLAAERRRLDDDYGIKQQVRALIAAGLSEAPC